MISSHISCPIIYNPPKKRLLRGLQIIPMVLWYFMNWIFLLQNLGDMYHNGLVQIPVLIMAHSKTQNQSRRDCFKAAI